MSREILHIVTNQDRLTASVKGLVAEAHVDDITMAMIAGCLAQRNVGLTIATSTDSAARDLLNYTKETLRLKRRKEAFQQAKIIDAAEIHLADLPDAELANYQAEGVQFLSQIIASTKPDFIIAPHPLDPHPDHRAAAEIVKITANDIPVYYMDTITGRDMNGKRVSPSHFVPMTRNDVRRRRRVYFTNESQVKDLPDDEMKDVFDVLRMPQRRGKDIGVPFAGALVFDQSRCTSDPLVDIFKNDIYVKDNKYPSN